MAKQQQALLYMCLHAVDDRNLTDEKLSLRI